MRTRLPLVLSATALVVAVLGTTGPAVAHGVRHALFAHNAGKVDGRDATGFNASLTNRKGKLVATSAATGRVNDAELLDGMDSAAFLGSGLFTGRINDLNALGGSSGPPTGMSQASNSTVDVWTLSPDRAIRMHELVVRLTANAPGNFVSAFLNAWASDGTTHITQLTCSIPEGASECTSAGPSAVIPPRSFLVLNIGAPPFDPLPAGTDALFSWRASGA